MAFAPQTDRTHIPLERPEELHRALQREFAECGAETACGGWSHF